MDTKIGMSMLRIAHHLIVWIYVLLPAVVVAWDLVRSRRRGRVTLSGNVLMTFIAAVAIGGALAVIYALAVGGAVRVGQLLLAIYFAAGLLFLLKLFDLGLIASVAWGARSVGGRIRRPLPRRSAIATILLMRWIVLFGVGLPYVMATVLTYRPKVGLTEDPQITYGWSYQPVRFEATDGRTISGWWIPSQPDARAAGSERAAKRTVLVCHGLGANKANHLILAQSLVPAGYNVLVFDFRAHGESEGQLASFGDLERRDVLGAVRWLRQNHPAQAVEIFGVGASMGAAALIAAAADRSPEGQAIAALAVYGTYDDLAGLADSVAISRFPRPLRWLVHYLAVPMASLQAGTNLSQFSPASAVRTLWPRPILVIHGVQDEIIDFEHGRRLFDAASPPKLRFWIEQASHNSIVDDRQTAEAVRRFFDDAEPMPVI